MIKPRSQRDWLTTVEAAKALGVGHQTILRWCKDHGFGRRPTPAAFWRIDPAKVAEFHARRTAS